MLGTGPKAFMGAMQRMARMLTPLSVIELFRHEITDHGPCVRFRRNDQQSNSSKRGKKFHVQSQCKMLEETIS